MATLLLLGSLACSKPSVPAIVPSGPSMAAAALQYALAFRDGKWDDAIDRTQWMSERLARVRASVGTEDAVQTERAILRKRLQMQSVENNQLKAEGVEDQYLFASGTQVEVSREEAGRSDLGAVRRIWLRVTFSDATLALRDVEGLPIRSLIVGVNLTADGLVTKAAVVGNLEIDRASISYGWS